MTINTIYGTVTVPVVLGSGSYGTTLTIAAGGLLQPTQVGVSALVAPQPGDAIFNLGTIVAASGVASNMTGGEAISMYGFGVLVNSGLIKGGNSGLDEQDPKAGGDGIDLRKAGFVSNNGTVVGGAGGGSASVASNGGIGIYLRDGGTVHNSGTIVGGIAGITASGGAEGGVGLMLAEDTMVVNKGSIYGGHGADIVHVGETTSEGAAIEFMSDGELINGGTIGQQTNSNGGVVGVGSIVVGNFGTIFSMVMRGGGALTNAGMILGENGSASIQGFPSSGGAGLDVDGPAKLLNAGTITGGNGYGSSSFGGGSGGAGVILTAGQEFLLNEGDIFGGAGSEYAPGGGGIGLSLVAGDVLTNQGRITGGEDASNSSLSAYGAGVEINSGLLLNSGIIIGGDTSAESTSAAAGVFVNGGILVAEAGTIEGGAFGANKSRNGYAVQFGSTTPGTLVINPNATFIGGIQASEAVPDTLFLAGSTPGTLAGFDQASGVNHFAHIFEASGSHWKLTGTISAPSLVFGGTSWLEVGNVTRQTNLYFSSTGQDQIHLIRADNFDGVFHGFNIGDSIYLEGLLGNSLRYDHGALSVLNSESETLTVLSFVGEYAVSDFAIKTLQNQTEISWHSSLLPLFYDQK